MGASRRGWNPYRRFTVILGGTMVIFAIVLSVAAVMASDSYIIKETVGLTETAVQDHFTKLPQFAPIFHSTALQGTANYPGAAADAHQSHGGAEAPYNDDTIYAFVRLHFDIYAIMTSNFYTPDGTVRFSYDKALIGRKVEGDEQASFRSALNGRIEVSRPGAHVLQLWMPVMDNGVPIGVAGIRRDITVEERHSRNLQLLLLGIILLGTASLFFALRQVFLRSARVIGEQNAELAALLTRIENTYDESLQALTSALDYRDNETQGHSFRVTSYALLLGKRMGLTGDDLDRLARGALLHDVGKIGVPDAILLKPGKLDEHEWTIMRQHVQLGYQMLQHIEFLQPSLDVVRYHHERWDGGGYPHGTAGNDIPLYARIFALCDTYDAMTSDRPYRKGLGYEAAREEIEQCCGTQFCPEVVDVFLSIDHRQWTTLQLAGYEADGAPGKTFQQTAAGRAERE